MDRDGIRAEGPVHILHAAHALRTEEHFVYASGRHGSAYVNKDLLYAQPGYVQILADGLSKMIAEEHWSVHQPMPMFVGPAMGGALVAQSRSPCCTRRTRTPSMRPLVNRGTACLA